MKGKHRFTLILAITALLVVTVGAGAQAQQMRTCFGSPATPLPAGQMATDGDDEILTGPFNDVVISLGGDDTIRTQGGFDKICSGAGNEPFVDGAGGNDMIAGSSGDDLLDGDNFETGTVVNEDIQRDQIFGQGGDDTITGGVGDDLVRMGPGNDNSGTAGGTTNAGRDRVFGESGNDMINEADIGLNPDVIDGGSGTDTCIVDENDSAVNCELMMDANGNRL